MAIVRTCVLILLALAGAALRAQAAPCLTQLWVSAVNSSSGTAENPQPGQATSQYGHSGTAWTFSTAEYGYGDRAAATLNGTPLTLTGVSTIQDNYGTAIGFRYQWSYSGAFINGGSLIFSDASSSAPCSAGNNTMSFTFGILPLAPVATSITAPLSVAPGSTGLQASVPAQSGAVYAWSITGGAFSSSTSTPAVSFRAGPVGRLRLTCVVTIAGSSGTGTATVSVARNDFTGEGRSDLLWANPGTGAVAILAMNGIAAPADQVVFTMPDTNWTIAAIGNFDRSARPSLVWRHAVSGQIMLQGFNGLAPGNSMVVYTEPRPEWQIVGAGDFNGDGIDDLLWYDSLTAQVWVGAMAGFAQAGGAMLYTASGLQWRIAAIGDFDGDGHPDLVWRNLQDGRVCVTLFNPDLTEKGEAMIYAEPNQAWQIVGSGDFDGDGCADLVWYDSATGQVYLQFLHGLGQPTGAMVYTASSLSWKIVAVEDVDGDGRPDLVWRNAADGTLFVQLYNGTAILAEKAVAVKPDPWRPVPGN